MLRKKLVNIVNGNRRWYFRRMFFEGTDLFKILALSLMRCSSGEKNFCQLVVDKFPTS